MRRKYIVCLVIVGILFLGSLTLGVGYGLWSSKNNNEEKIATNVECFKIYFSEPNNILLKNISPVLENEGKKTSPYTITVTNICNETKELQIRLNVLKESTIKTDSLSINATGSITIDNNYYVDLKTTKSIEDDVSQSKLIGTITLAPNETARTNIKLWFNELKNPMINKEDYMNLRFELINAQNAILPTLKENIMDLNKAVEKEIKYNEPATTNELIKIDNKYYFRGNVTNNYLEFAGRLWRIVGINENNTIKIILNDTLEPIKYSNYTNASDYTGFTYIYNNETINNNITNQLFDWYQNNLITYDSYIVNSKYCNDSSREFKNGQSYFGAYQRLNNDKKPSTVCPETNNDYGGEYKQKIGLLTADEVAISGAVYNQENPNYYLNNGTTFYTMSPSTFMYGYQAYVMYVDETGTLTSTLTTKEQGLRPVITLSSHLTSEGTGTLTDPYRIISKDN